MMGRMYYFTRILDQAGYKSCGRTGGAEFFYNAAETSLGIVVCESNQADVVSDIGIKRMRGYFKQTLHGMEDEDILVIVFGYKKNLAFTEDNVVIVNDMCRRIEEKRVQPHFKPIITLLKKSISYAKNEDRQSASRTARLGMHETYSSYVIYALIAANVFLYTNIFMNPGAYGADTEDVLLKGESYRLISYMFMHGSLSHLISNMFSLYYIGKAITRRIGNVNVFIIYITGGILGGLASCYMGILGLRNMHTVTVGASGAIFALLGALLIDVLMNSSNNKKGVIKYCLTTLILSSISARVDIACHIFGFAGGAITMYIINMLNAIHCDVVSINAVKKKRRILSNL